MFLDLKDNQLKRVYELSAELKSDPTRMRLAQALTLNPAKPLLGLKGRHGLLGSEEWWESIRSGRIRTQIVSGAVESLYFAGQDSRWGDEVNSFKLRLEDGSVMDESIYGDNKADKRLFRLGAIVSIAYAFDELKCPTRDGSPDYAKVTLEMAVSRA